MQWIYDLLFSRQIFHLVFYLIFQWGTSGYQYNAILFTVDLKWHCFCIITPACLSICLSEDNQEKGSTRKISFLNKLIQKLAWYFNFHQKKFSYVTFIIDIQQHTTKVMSLRFKVRMQRLRIWNLTEEHWPISLCHEIFQSRTQNASKSCWLFSFHLPC